jgi:hypothetical protein
VGTYQFPGQADLALRLLLALEVCGLGADVDDGDKPGKANSLVYGLIGGDGFGICSNGTPRFEWALRRSG